MKLESGIYVYAANLKFWRISCALTASPIQFYMLQGTAAVRIATAAGNPHLLSLAVLHCVAYIK